MKRLFTIVMMFLYSIALNAQGVLPKAISKDLPSDYKYTETRVISSDNEKTIEGIVTFSLPQKNKCFGADSGYITVSYKYFSKLNIPTATEIAKKKDAFDNGIKKITKKLLRTFLWDSLILTTMNISVVQSYRLANTTKSIITIIL